MGLCLLGLSTGMGMGTAIAQDKEAAGAWPRWSVAFIAHRGLAPGYPENTLAAYREAIKLGAEALEIDLRGTKDGEVVILHDETLERTTDGTGKVTDKTLAELKRLDAGKGERIPTYEEVLQLVNGTGVKLLLDIKESPVLDKKRIVDLTEKHNAVLNVIVGPRNLADLRTFRSLNPNLRTLGFIAKTDDIEPFAQAGRRHHSPVAEMDLCRAASGREGARARTAGLDHGQRRTARGIGEARQARRQRHPHRPARRHERPAARHARSARAVVTASPLAGEAESRLKARPGEGGSATLPDSTRCHPHPVAAFAATRPPPSRGRKRIDNCAAAPDSRAVPRGAARAAEIRLSGRDPLNLIRVMPAKGQDAARKPPSFWPGSSARTRHRQRRRDHARRAALPFQ